MSNKVIDSFDGKHRYLSNFWGCLVMKGDWVYPSVENAYQAAKFPKSQRSLFANISPTAAKRLGQKVTPANWETEKVVVMRGLLEQKFRCGTYNSQLLMATRGKDIIEGNTWGDTFWGVCDGVGENRLGKMLMEIREDLIKEMEA